MLSATRKKRDTLSLPKCRCHGLRVYPPTTRKEKRNFLHFPAGTNTKDKQWQVIKGWDTHSIIAETDPAITFDAETYTLTLTTGSELSRVGCEKIASIDSDFSGQSIGSSPLPGPFQNLTTGTATIGLLDNSQIPVRSPDYRQTNKPYSSRPATLAGTSRLSVLLQRRRGNRAGVLVKEEKNNGDVWMYTVQGKLQRSVHVHHGN